MKRNECLLQNSIPKLGYDVAMPTVKPEENTVLLVMDDGDEDVKLITSLLEKSGFQVVRSANKAEVLDVCRTGDDAIQLMIADTGTPGIQISEFLEELQAVNPRVRVLVISAKKGPEPVKKTSNVRAYLSRPFRRAQFLGSVLDAAKGPLVRTA